MLVRLLVVALMAIVVIYFSVGLMVNKKYQNDKLATNAKLGMLVATAIAFVALAC